jgi:hypothetical protein
MSPRCRGIIARMAVLAVGLMFFLAFIGCSEEARARRGLNRVVHQEIDQFNKYNRRKIKPQEYISGNQFYRIYHEREDPVINMRRTNSIDTPYMATLNFTEHTYLTKKHSSAEECRRDSHFILSNTVKREIVFTFAGGSWRKKESY